MTDNWYFIEVFLRERQKDLLREAERLRTANRARRGGDTEVALRCRKRAERSESMGGCDIDPVYKAVPSAQVEELREFRAAHPLRSLAVRGALWEYIACGNAIETLVILPGGLRSGEAAFRLIMNLERDYRIIAPTYPPLDRMERWVQGIRAILDHERVGKAHVFGSSAGGMLAQCLVRSYPEIVDGLIIGSTSLPGRERGERYKKAARILLFIPIRLVKALAKRRITTMARTFPEDRRLFWLAYLKELVEKTYSRSWLRASYEAGIDYMMNYTFHVDDMARWDGQMLIVASDDDLAIGQEQFAALKRMYPCARVYAFRNAGHLAALTMEAEYISLLRDFLRRASPMAKG